MVLEAMELHLRSDMTENIGEGLLTREHIMPDSWESHWPLPEGADKEEAKKARNESIKEIGNLTLVTGKLNTYLSNAAWRQKKETLKNHTALRLNWDLLDNAPEVWDEESIRERSEQLIKLAAAIWPSAESI